MCEQYCDVHFQCCNELYIYECINYTNNKFVHHRTLTEIILSARMSVVFFLYFKTLKWFTFKSLKLDVVNCFNTLSLKKLSVKFD